uniref:hypothetical protein n=1 Tax=Rickettsia sp. TH2014 TaxID=1967503 RepID=UPI001C440C5E
NLTSLYLGNNDIRDKGLLALSKSDYLTHLNILDMMQNAFGIPALHEFASVLCTHVSNIRVLDLTGNNLNVEALEFLGRTLLSTVQVIYNAVDGSEQFYAGVVQVALNKDKGYEQLVQAVKSMVFDIAPYDTTGEIVTYILTHYEQYPFLVNCVSEGRALNDFYGHNFKMQLFLFSQGIIPYSPQENLLQNIASDAQSVHHTEIYKKNCFLTSHLLHILKPAISELIQKAHEYTNNLEKILQQHSLCLIALLSSSKGEKLQVMENVLEANQAMPDDKEFIKVIINKVLYVLQHQYLSQTSTCGYYDSLLQYDWTSGEEKYITIPQSIDLINIPIETTKPSRTIKQELCATLLEHSPSLIPDKLVDIKNPCCDHIVTSYPIMDKAKLHELLSQIDEHQIEKLFNASGFNISQVWTMQKEFALAKQLYIAATTYGENNSACITGI